MRRKSFQEQSIYRICTTLCNYRNSRVLVRSPFDYIIFVQHTWLPLYRFCFFLWLIAYFIFVLIFHSFCVYFHPICQLFFNFFLHTVYGWHALSSFMISFNIFFIISSISALARLVFHDTAYQRKRNLLYFLFICIEWSSISRWICSKRWFVMHALFWFLVFFGSVCRFLSARVLGIEPVGEKVWVLTDVIELICHLCLSQHNYYYIRCMYYL